MAFHDAFSHLQVHTEFSMSEGLLRINALMQAVVARNMKAIAITDCCNLFAVVKFYKAALSFGVKPIIGCEIFCHPDDAPEDLSSLILLCQNNIGYKNLTQLVSRAWQEGQVHGGPRISMAWLHCYQEGLMMLSGGIKGCIGKALLQGKFEQAETFAKTFQALFKDRFYLTLQRTGRKDETFYNEQTLRLADSLALPVVATNHVCFMNEADFEAHEARVSIHEGITLDASRLNAKYTREQYLRSHEEMLALFEDIPEAIQNTKEIAKRCTVTLSLGENYLPDFPVPNNISVEAWLCREAQKGLETRFLEQLKAIDNASKALYEARLKTELEVINRMGFGGYFLIVADFIKWARDNAIPVGPGRGSGAGSLVAYALKITDLDPLQYDLLFERFLNPERVSMPDFDIDFCMEGRDRVIEYVAEKYGRQNVSQIITFGTMAAKAVVRDVGRVLGYPYGFVDKLAKLVPFELGMTLKRALDEVPELYRRYQDEEEVKELLTLAMQLEGVTRNAGKHAGGVVIAPSALTDFTAIYCEPGSKQIVSQLDKDDVEAAGLVKFDFLGLRTLTIIDKALAMIHASSDKNQVIAITNIPVNDAKTFELLKRGTTTAIFQLESRGMKELITRLKPDCFEDIIALVALFRPGPLQSGMVDDFIQRKHGESQVIYPHEAIEPILKPTYGVILYQEQVMQIAQVLAGYTLGAADLLRRAMGKKKPEEMARQREIFIKGAKNRGVAIEVAQHIFDLMEKFAGYGFNKSHSAAYALVSYQTAWLKAHYPAPFMASVLSSDMDNTDKIVVFLEECRRMGLRVEPPSINASLETFSVLSKTEILYGLGAIKGVGSSAISQILEARQKHGSFNNLFEFVSRLDLRKVNRRVLEALIKSGAMDVFQIERSVLMASLEKSLKMAEFTQKNRSFGQSNLFSLIEDETCEACYENATRWSELLRLQGEKETLGLYLTGHPATIIAREFSAYLVPMSELSPKKGKMVWVAGLIVASRRIVTKRGKILQVLTVSSASHTLDVLLFPDTPGIHQAEVGACIFLEGEVTLNEFNGQLKMNTTKLYTACDFRIHLRGTLMLELSSETAHSLKALKDILMNHRGPLKVAVNWVNQKAGATLKLSNEWNIMPDDALLETLRQFLGEDKVWMKYDRLDNMTEHGHLKNACSEERA